LRYDGKSGCEFPEGLPILSDWIAPIGARRGGPPSIRPARLALLGRVAARMAKAFAPSGMCTLAERARGPPPIRRVLSHAVARLSPPATRPRDGPFPPQDAWHAQEEGSVEVPFLSFAPLPGRRFPSHIAARRVAPPIAASVLGSVVHPRGRIRHKDPPSSALPPCSSIAVRGRGSRISVLYGTSPTASAPSCTHEAKSFFFLRARADAGTGPEKVRRITRGTSKFFFLCPPLLFGRMTGSGAWPREKGGKRGGV